MATLDRIIQMQAQGISEQDIIKTLRNEGISTTEINDGLSQAKIKQAVQEPEFQGMEQSMMDQSGAPAAVEQQNYPVQQNYPPQNYPPQTQGYAPEYQDQYAQYQQQAAPDTETITDIADQVVQEKFAEFNKKTGDLVAFKNDTREKLKDLDERLKRIENAIDQLQRAIIGKIGEYGENMSYVRKDLENVHDTMSKLMNPLVDNYQQLRKIAGTK